MTQCLETYEMRKQLSIMTPVGYIRKDSIVRRQIEQLKSDMQNLAKTRAWVCLLQPRTGYGRVPRSRQAEAGQPDALPGICQGFAPPSLPHWAVSHGDSDLRVNVNSQLMYPKVKTF